MKTLLFVSLICASFLSEARSTMRVVNKSIYEVQAIWQAGGCFYVVEDWEGDKQFTVCAHEDIWNGRGAEYIFGTFDSDRSVKLFTHEHGMIGYCNSMDDATLTVNNDEEGNLVIEHDCP